MSLFVFFSMFLKCVLFPFGEYFEVSFIALQAFFTKNIFKSCQWLLKRVKIVGEDVKTLA